MLFFLAIFLNFSLFGAENFTFFSSQERKDIKNGLLKALSQESEEILFSIYALTDPDIIESLSEHAKKGHSVSIWTHNKHLISLKKKMLGPIQWIEHPQKGLMHHKIFLIGNQCFLGSANLTPTSLKMHDNLMISLYSPPLAYALKKMLTQFPRASKFISDQITLYLLPHPEVLDNILSKIEMANSEICAAFFTFTHEEIAKALVKAHQRGVHVKVLLDASSSKAASQKIANYLKENGVPLFINRGTQLMHHKICLIDQKTFLFGSCNWTKNAFKKNNDFIALLEKLSKKESTWIKKQLKHLFWESKPYP